MVNAVIGKTGLCAAAATLLGVATIAVDGVQLQPNVVRLASYSSRFPADPVV